MLILIILLFIMVGYLIFQNIQLRKDLKSIRQQITPPSLPEPSLVPAKPEVDSPVPPIQTTPPSPPEPLLVPTEPEENNQFPPTYDGIEITNEFRDVFDKIERTNNCYFITGKAGTGKSTFLQYFRENTQKKIVILAPTGVAALNVKGQTIHSFFGFPSRALDPDHIQQHIQRYNRNIFKQIDTIIIDEVSMVRADIMDAIDIVLRQYGRNPGSPFGGIQIIFLGDLYQLPPVVSTGAEAVFLSERYNTFYFFGAPAICQREINLTLLELTKVFRQNNLNFIEILDRIRTGLQTDADIQLLNQNVRVEADLFGQEYVYLTTLRDIADHINQQKLHNIESQEFSFLATIEGDFPHQRRFIPARENLTLKIGAQVMFIKNDRLGRWVNGTIGKIVFLTENNITVAIDENHYNISKETWEYIKYRYNQENGRIIPEVIGKFTQYPLILAWAFTIHKSQGMTFDNIYLDLGNGAFEYGQTYVALSRCKNIEGIKLRNPITHNDIKVDPSIENFLTPTLQPDPAPLPPPPPITPRVPPIIIHPLSFEFTKTVTPSLYYHGVETIPTQFRHFLDEHHLVELNNNIPFSVSFPDGFTTEGLLYHAHAGWGEYYQLKITGLPNMGPLQEIVQIGGNITYHINLVHRRAEIIVP